MRKRNVVRGAIVLGWLTVLIVAPRPARAGDESAERPLDVFAAASLTTALRALGAAFSASHARIEPAFNFAGSPTLARQILDGAPADVFASADEPTMERLGERGALAGAPVVFARNRLQIAVAKGNPKRVTGLADLIRAELIVVLCGETVPAGRYALAAFAKAGVTPPAGSRELDVKAVVAKIELGEADAGVVYVTDVRAAAAVDGVDLPDAQNVVARYPIAAIAGSPRLADARAFIDFVRSAAGTRILAEHGFLPP